jgi:CRISPR system Cascade subunit CasE
MFLTRSSLAELTFDNPEKWRMLADEYALHRAIWQRFPTPSDGKRNFLYRVDSVQGKPVVWTLATQPPKSDARWCSESRVVEPVIQQGDRLEFEARVNPVVRRGGKKHDIVMDLKSRLGWKDIDPEKREPEAILIQRASEDWLNARVDRFGFRVEMLVNQGYRVHSFPAPGKRNLHFGFCDWSGVLRVEDPALFLDSWRQGIGSARGFGCGLLLIKRARG